MCYSKVLLLQSVRWWCFLCKLWYTAGRPVNNPVSYHHGHRSVFVFGVVVGWGGWRVSFLVYSSVLMSLHDNRATVQHLVVLSRQAGPKLLARHRMIQWAGTQIIQKFLLFFNLKKKKSKKESDRAETAPYLMRISAAFALSNPLSLYFKEVVRHHITPDILVCPHLQFIIIIFLFFQF